MKSVLFMLGVCFCVSVAAARTITVDNDGPADFNNIQSAINDANVGDTILVDDGIYTGPNNKNLDFDGKDVILQSSNGPEHTIIDCENDGRGFHFQNFETTDAKVIGFTITNGYISEGHGGAIFLEFSGLSIENCIIEDNIAEYSGGAILCDSGTGLIIKNCKIENNTALYYSGGGIFTQYCDVTLENTIIAANQAGGYGGGMIIYDTGLYDIINTTITDNNDIAGGGGIYIFYDADVLIMNSIIYANDSQQIAEYSVAFSPIVEYCDVQGGYEGLGNIDIDPCFVDAENGNYHLKSQVGQWDPNAPPPTDLWADGFVDLLDFAEFANSWRQEGPGLDADFNRDSVVDLADLFTFAEDYLTAGTPGAWVNDEATSRCIDAGNPASHLMNEPVTASNVRVDIGAYGGTEQTSYSPQYWSLLADLNNDGTVDFVDFAHISYDWLQTDWQVPGDLSRDGTVNIFDLLPFTKDWLQTTSWHN